MKERVILGLLTLSILGGAAYAATTLPSEPDAPAIAEAPKPSVTPATPAAPLAVGLTPAVPATPAPPATPATPAKAMTPPVGTAVDGSPLTLRGQLSHPWLAADQADLPLSLQIDVDAPEAAVQARVPMDIAIVIDRSGSMEGAKLRDAQQAALRFVERLDPGDRVALITYDSQARLDSPLQAPQQDALRRTIQSLRARGGTNIHHALQLADATFEGAGTPGRVRRVILLSDGRANQQADCATIAQHLLKRGVSTTTMGLGADYDEKMLTQIADSGAGSYYFLASAAHVAPAFDREIASLQSLIADNAVVELKLAPGVRLDQLHGFPFERTDDSTIRVPLAAFPAKRNASILIDLRVDSRRDATFPVAEARLTYSRLSDNSALTHTIALTAAPTPDANLVHAWRNAEVLARIEKLRNAAVLEQAMKELEQGNKDRAQKLLQDRKAEFDKNRADLKDARLGSRGRSGLIGLDEDSDSLGVAAQEVQAAKPAASAADTRNLIKRNRASNRDIQMAY